MVLLLCTLQAVVLIPLEDGNDKVPIGNHHYILWKLLLGAMTPLQKASNLHTPWRIRIFASAKVPRVPDGTACKSTVLELWYLYYKPEIECSQEGRMLLDHVIQQVIVDEIYYVWIYMAYLETAASTIRTEPFHLSPVQPSPWLF